MTSLRKLALTSTMTVLILVTLFPSCVKADVQLSQKFMEPVKNWSFEERDNASIHGGYPNDGVYECPPWESNGGWRDLRGDINGDGFVSGWDLSILSDAWMTKVGEDTDYPNADLNGDGYVSGWDLTILSDDLGKKARYIDGKYSWYTNGGGDYQMWQELDSETIAGQKVMFSYYFYPESLNSGQESASIEGHHRSPDLLFVRRLSITPPAGIAVHVTKVGFDTYVTGGTGNYRIEFQRGDDYENTVVIANDTFTNTVYETKEHTCDLWGNPGEKVAVNFFIGSESLAYWVYYKNSYMNYDLPVPARAEIYYEYLGGSNTINGTWIAPTELDWWNVYVTASLPSTVTDVKVIIHGKPDFKAWVDFAELTIIDQAQKTSDYGDVTLAVATYYWFKKTIQPDGEVWFVPALHAESAAGYGIIGTKLKIELLPPPGTATPQEGFLHIYYCHQGNEEGYEINPEATEEKQARLLTVGGLAITIGTAIATGYGVGFLLGAGSQYLGIFKVFAGTPITRGAVALLHMLASDPNVKDSQEAGKNYVLEYWGDYPTFSHEYHPTPFVDIADASANVQWLFNSESADTFTIKITASVWWGQKNYYPGHYDGSHWELDSVGWTHAVTYMTVNA